VAVFVVGRVGLAGRFYMSAPNLQDSFFQSAQQGRKHVTIYLLNGVKLSGKVCSFDKYSVIVENESTEQLVFKHSISAVFLCRNKKCPECFPAASGTGSMPMPKAV
jgi:host factor-I protein